VHQWLFLEPYSHEQILRRHVFCVTHNAIEDLKAAMLPDRIQQGTLPALCKIMDDTLATQEFFDSGNTLTLSDNLFVSLTM